MKAGVGNTLYREELRLQVDVSRGKRTEEC